MDEQQIRQIIRDELSWLIKNDRLVLTKPVQLMDGNHIVLGKTLGGSIGSAPDQKLAFFGSTGATQAAFVDNPSGGAVIDQNCRNFAASVRDAFAQYGLMASP